MPRQPAGRNVSIRCKFADRVRAGRSLRIVFGRAQVTILETLLHKLRPCIPLSSNTRLPKLLYNMRRSGSFRQHAPEGQPLCNQVSVPPAVGQAVHPLTGRVFAKDESHGVSPQRDFGAGIHFVFAGVPVQPISPPWGHLGAYPGTVTLSGALGAIHCPAERHAMMFREGMNRYTGRCEPRSEMRTAKVIFPV